MDTLRSVRTFKADYSLRSQVKGLGYESKERPFRKTRVVEVSKPGRVPGTRKTTSMCGGKDSSQSCFIHGRELWKDNVPRMQQRHIDGQILQ